MPQSDEVEAKLQELFALAMADASGGTTRFRAVAAEMYRSYRDDVQRFAARRLPASSVDDICGATWAEVPEALERFQNESTFRTWLLGITNNKAKNELRRAKKREHAALSGVILKLCAPRSQGLSSKFERGEPVHRVMAQLDEDEQALLVQHYEKGLTAAEIGVALGVETKAVAQRIFRTKRRVIKLFREAGSG